MIKCTQTSEKAYIPPQVLPLQRVSGLLRPMPCKRGWEWAFEGKPNRAPHAVGATESVSVNKAGMCWHITSGQGHSCQDWVAPQEHLIRSCPNARTCFGTGAVFIFPLVPQSSGRGVHPPLPRQRINRILPAPLCAPRRGLFLCASHPGNSKSPPASGPEGFCICFGKKEEWTKRQRF